MNYFILRDGLQYGPYSQAEVQRYLRIGDIYPGDLSRTEKMNRWLPVSQVLGSAAPPPSSPEAPCSTAVSPNNGSSASATTFASTTVRLPPRLSLGSASVVSREPLHCSWRSLLRDWFRHLWSGH